MCLILGDNRLVLWHYGPAMLNVTLDTHRAINVLKEHGFDEKNAEGIVEVLKAQNVEHLATKEDVLALKADLFKWLAVVLVGQVAAFAVVVKWILGSG